MSRSRSYEASSEELRGLTSLLLQSVEEQQSTLETVLDEILGVARILPLERTTFSKAVEFQKTRSLEPQDSIVYASVIADLERGIGGQSSFITKNPKDFANPDIEDGDLAKYECALMTTFAAGLSHVRTLLSSGRS